MFDIYVAQLVLSERKIAYFVTNQSLQIIGYGGHLQLVRETQEPLSTDEPAINRLSNGFLGLSIVDFTPELVGHEEQLRALLAGELATFRLDFINRENPQGDLVYLNLTLYPRLDEQKRPQGLLYLLEDVTAMGRAAQQLTQQHNELYLLHRQLHDTNLQLTAANAELRALDELKSRFVSIAAHELRTPIATMLGYMDFMLQDDQEALSPNQQNHLEIVRRSTKRLLTITSDLLDVTRIEAGRMELLLESVNLSRLVSALLTEFQPEIAKKQLTVTFHAPTELPPTLCDEKRTIQIFTNLLSNAIKYTPEQGTIALALQQFRPPADPGGDGGPLATEQSVSTATRVDMEQPSVILAKIIDTGIGIPQADLAQMGKAFFRASNAHKARVSGTGLGLHITRSLCELQGGTLWFESQEGQGTTAFVTIPIDDGIFAG
ncbi:MAG: HAMP domain-containing histidine kinase [Caldilineaceae bacterium]|nr:HAMP domain-containing histidine kinase [Caldilineaceae bacterium]